MISKPNAGTDPTPQDVEPASHADTTPITEPAEPQRFDAQAEAQFLTDEFGIAPLRAAEILVPAEDQAQAVAAEVRERDPLQDVPVPGPEKDAEHVEQGIEDLEKPVAHRPAAAS